MTLVDLFTKYPKVKVLDVLFDEMTQEEYVNFLHKYCSLKQDCFSEGMEITPDDMANLVKSTTNPNTIDLVIKQLSE